MTKAFASAVLCVFTFVAATGVARASATPAQKCASSKIRETGKKANGKLKCWSKEVVRPGGLAACNARVEGKFADRFARAEAQGGCASTGDAGSIEATVDAFVDDVVTALTGSPPGTSLGTVDAKRCAGGKLKAAGKKTASKTTCYSKAATAGALDPLCLSAAEARFSQSWGAAEDKGGCATSGDRATIEGKVDTLVNASAPCGDGIVIGPGETCDPPGQPGQCPAGQSCNSDCTGCQTVCGDGIVIGPGETCDPPGQPGQCPPGQTCNSDCTGCQTVCGDGVIGSGETCDPPGAQSTCSAGTICKSTCSGCEPNCSDRCQTGPAMNPACGPCVASVCSAAPNCCNNAWDSVCVGVSELLCGACPFCGDGVIGPGEMCEPPGRQSTCGTNQVCSDGCGCLACPTPTVIPPAGGTLAGSTVGGSSVLASRLCGQSEGRFSSERTFAWTPAVSGTATITMTCPTFYDPYHPALLYILADACAGTELACGWCQIEPTVTAGQTYIIVVDGRESYEEGSFTLTVVSP